MNRTDAPYRSPVIWPAPILSTSSLCYFLLATIQHPRSGGFFVRYASVALGIAITTGLLFSVVPYKSLHRWWLLVVIWAGVVISLVGVYQMPR